MASNRGQTVAVGLALLAGLLLIGWAASTGPGDVASGDGYLNRAPDQTVTPPPQQQAQPPPHATPTHVHRPLLDHDRFREVVTVVVVLGLAWLLWRFRHDLQLPRHRRRKKALANRPEADVGELPDIEQARESVLRTREEQLAALVDGTPRNGIVACWVLLEEAAARSRVGRDPAETSMEFLVRFLHRLDVDPRAAGRLAALYHEARFSSHALTEVHRSDAQAALDTIHAGIASSRRTTNGAER